VLYSGPVKEDSRDTERVVILGELQAEIMMFESMLIKEISRTGATVDTRFPLQLNSLHDLRLTLGDRSVILKGRVVHSRISDVDQDIVTYRTGLEFVEPSERVADVIAQFLDEVKGSRSIEAK
jgi:hypothetical protein